MELKTQALDRVLEALSPALTAELDRVVQETRDALEQEFQERLQAAVREAEEAARATAQAEIERAIAETTDATRKAVTDELEQQFKNKLDDVVTELNNQGQAERARLQEQADQWRVFADTQRQLAEATSQPQILSRFLRLADGFAGGLAVYVTKTDGLALWKSRGERVFPEIISQETADPEFYFRTIIIRGKTVAAVYAAPPFKSEALEFLSASLDRAIEAFGLKLRAPVPKPVISETTVAIPSNSPSIAKPAVSSTTTTLGAEEEKAHAEARKIARLLVSGIKLYHEQEIKDGRQNGDIYQRLQKEIDQARETYRRRVPSEVLASPDYFHEELVRILGDNDPSRLGAAYPGPK